jgi:Fe-S-cluster containining protein
VLSLSIHADYGCRNSGACCRHPWPLPVERGAARRLRERLAEGRLAAAGPSASLPAEQLFSRGPRGVSLLARDGGGRCHFHEPDSQRCAIHARLGSDALPTTCRMFPRLATLAPGCVRVTLSHFCPTAAALLFREDTPLAIVAAPPAFPAAFGWDGLDARRSFGPELRPGVLLGWDGLLAWERRTVALLGRADLRPEDALHTLHGDAERVRSWRVGDRTPAGLIEELPARDGRPSPASGDGLLAALRESLDPRFPLPLPLPASAPPPLAWRGQEEPVRRFLAAHAFASWEALHARDLRSAVLALECALLVLRTQVERLAGDLREAFRAADLVLIHHVRRDELARRLDALLEAP